MNRVRELAIAILGHEKLRELEFAGLMVVDTLAFARLVSMIDDEESTEK